jgi:hypothetical protein
MQCSCRVCSRREGDLIKNHAGITHEADEDFISLRSLDRSAILLKHVYDLDPKVACSRLTIGQSSKKLLYITASNVAG